MNEIFLFLLSPLVGAVIGYVTNAIAIRMLFRPLKEVRLLGIRVPFTPGIIPRQKRSLAVNIGKMVSGELFTPQVLESRLNDPVWRDSLVTTVNQEIEKVLWNTPVNTYWGSQELWETWCRQMAKSLPKDELSEFLKDGLRVLSKPGEENKPSYLAQAFDQIYPQLLAKIMDWVRSPLVYEQLVSLSRSMLKQAFERMSGVQKFFISIVQYDKNIDENMPEILQDLLEKTQLLLQGEVMTDHFKASIETGLSPENLDLDSWIQKTILKITEDIQSDQDSNLRDFLFKLGMKTPGEILFPNQKSRPDWASPTEPVAAKWLVEKGLNYLSKQITPILGSLNIQTMIEQKIMDLDERKVEDLLMMVLRKHLKYINVFGAILGALIGFLQNLIRT